MTIYTMRLLDPCLTAVQTPFQAFHLAGFAGWSVGGRLATVDKRESCMRFFIGAGAGTVEYEKGFLGFLFISTAERPGHG